MTESMVEKLLGQAHVETIAPMGRANADALAALIQRFWGTPDVAGFQQGLGRCSFTPRERLIAEELRAILTKYAPWHPAAALSSGEQDG